MEFRLAKEADLPLIEKIEKERFSSDRWTLQQWKYEICENKFSFVYVCLEDNVLIGYIDYWILFDQATINKICVDKKYENHGFGKRLMQEALQRIDKALCLSTTLEVRVSNEPAIRLYEKCLFKKVLCKEQYYSDGEDCYFMIRSIGDVYER